MLNKELTKLINREFNNNLLGLQLKNKRLKLIKKSLVLLMK